MPKKLRISSILKKSPSRTGCIGDITEDFTSTCKENDFTSTNKRCSRRVSFANSNQVKEIVRVGDIANEWQDSSSDSSNVNDPSSLLQHKITRLRPSVTGKPLQDLTGNINGLNQLLSAPLVNVGKEAIKEVPPAASSSFFDNSLIQLARRVEAPDVSLDVSVSDENVNRRQSQIIINQTLNIPHNITAKNEEPAPPLIISAMKLLASIDKSDGPENPKPKVTKLTAASLLSSVIDRMQSESNDNVPQELPDEPDKTAHFKPNFNSTMVGHNTNTHKALFISQDLDLTGHEFVSEPISENSCMYGDDQTKSSTTKSLFKNNKLQLRPGPYNEDKTIHFGNDVDMEMTECLESGNDRAYSSTNYRGRYSNDSTKAEIAVDLPSEISESNNLSTNACMTDGDATVHFNNDDGMDMSMTECISANRNAVAISANPNIFNGRGAQGGNFPEHILTNKSHFLNNKDKGVLFKNDEGMDLTDCINSNKILYGDDGRKLPQMMQKDVLEKGGAVYNEDQTVHFEHGSSMELTEVNNDAQNKRTVHDIPTSANEISQRMPADEDQTVHFGNDAGMELTECVKSSNLLNQLTTYVQPTIIEPNNADETVHLSNDVSMEITECVDHRKGAPIIVKSTTKEKDLSELRPWISENEDKTEHFGYDADMEMTECIKRTEESCQSTGRNNFESRVSRNDHQFMPELVGKNSSQQQNEADSSMTNSSAKKILLIETQKQSNLIPKDSSHSVKYQEICSDSNSDKDCEDDQVSMQSALRKRIARARSSLGVHASRMKRKKLSSNEDDQLSAVIENDQDESNIRAELSLTRNSYSNVQEENVKPKADSVKVSPEKCSVVTQSATESCGLSEDQATLNTFQELESSKSESGDEALPLQANQSSGNLLTHEQQNFDQTKDHIPKLNFELQHLNSEDIVEKVDSNNGVRVTHVETAAASSMNESQHNKSVNAELWYETTFSLEDDKNAKNIDLKKFLKLYTDVVIPNPDSGNRRSTLYTKIPPIEEMPITQKLAIMFKGSEHSIYQQFLDSLDSNVTELKKDIESAETMISNDNPNIFCRIRFAANEEERDILVEKVEGLFKFSKSIAKAQTKKIKSKLYKGLSHSFSRQKTDQLDGILKLVQNLNEKHSQAEQEITAGLKDIESEFHKIESKNLPTTEQISKHQKLLQVLKDVKCKKDECKSEFKTVLEALKPTEQKRSELMENYNELKNIQKKTAKKMEVAAELERYESFLGIKANLSPDKVEIEFFDSTLSLEASSVLPISGKVFSATFSNYSLKSKFPDYMPSPSNLKLKFEFVHGLIQKRVNIANSNKERKDLRTVINLCRAASLSGKLLFKELQGFLALNRCSLKINNNTVNINFCPRFKGPFNWYSVSFHYNESATITLTDASKEFIPAEYQISAEDENLKARVNTSLEGLVKKKPLKEIVQVLLENY